MLLGLIVIGGALGVALIMMQTSRTNTALGQVQSGARLAFELLAHDIRNARLTGCGASAHVANALTEQSTAWWANWDGNAFIGHAGGQVDPAVSIGTAPAQRAAGTDSITMMGAADTAMSVSAHDPVKGQFTVNGSIGSLGGQGGDVLIVCDPDRAAIFQTASAAGLLLTYDIESCVATPGLPGVCGGSAAHAFGANSQIAPLAATTWYVGISQSDSGEGKSWSLYRRTLVNSNDTPTPQAQEMVQGVSGLSLRYLQDGTFLAADDSSIDWSKVTAVQVHLNLQSSFQRAGTDGQPLARDYTATVALYNRLD
jgi:type IV pilus assembly protein PilW